MLDGRELATFRKHLLTWFREFQRDLPWRRNKDPYRIWLSEIMLQQTRVAAVIPYYERFLQEFPDVRTLAEAPQEEVLRLWSGLGYYSRARNLQCAAQQIVAKHHGEFPRESAEILDLPGIGAYTAAAILSIAFGEKHAVLDGNVARVLSRLGAVRGDLREGRRWQMLQETANRLLARQFSGDWNQAMMELGAMVCTPRAPQCLLCPLTKFCRARQLGIHDILPEKRKKRAGVRITLASAVLVDPGGHTLLLPAPRHRKKSAAPKEVVTLLSSMWHFPTIRVGENGPATELQEFLVQLFGRKSREHAPQLQALPKVRHAVTYREITVMPFRVAVAKLPRRAGIKRIVLSELCSASSLAISNLTRKVARAALIVPEILNDSSTTLKSS